MERGLEEGCSIFKEEILVLKMYVGQEELEKEK